MSDVKRWELSSVLLLSMECEGGRFVTYDDYAALRAELERVRGLADQLMRYATHRGDCRGQLIGGDWTCSCGVKQITDALAGGEGP